MRKRKRFRFLVKVNSYPSTKVESTHLQYHDKYTKDQRYVSATFCNFFPTSELPAYKVVNGRILSEKCATVESSPTLPLLQRATNIKRISRIKGELKEAVTVVRG